MAAWPTLSRSPLRSAGRIRKEDPTERTPFEGGRVLTHNPATVQRQHIWLAYDGMTGSDVNTVLAFENARKIGGEVFELTHPHLSTTHYVVLAEPIDYKPDPAAEGLWRIECHFVETGATSA